MLPPKLPGSPEQQRLLRLFRRLSRNDRRTLLDLAEFLAERSARDAVPGAADAGMQDEPLDIPRPDAESVVAAIRRLSQTFPMLDKDLLLHETADLMSAHVVQGRPAVEVIDELEIIFRRHYERVKSPSE